MNFFASLISYIFEPTIVMYFMALRAGAHVWYVTAFVLFVTLMRFVLARRAHMNWDISDRKKRIGPIIGFILLLGTQYIYVAHVADKMIAELFLLFFYWVVGFLLITFTVKISGHVGILTLAICLLTVWYGSSGGYLWLLVLLLAWSRVKLKRHSLIEVCGGFVYSILIFYLYETGLGFF